jgi:hypothetical protein
MTKYLGEISPAVHPYENYTKEDWCLLWILKYGGIDGAHHKDWVLDQVARILNGTPVIITEAKWDDGSSEYRFNLDEPTKEYTDWVAEVKSGEDGPNTYSYDCGITP